MFHKYQSMIMICCVRIRWYMIFFLIYIYIMFWTIHSILHLGMLSICILPHVVTLIEHMISQTIMIGILIVLIMHIFFFLIFFIWMMTSLVVIHCSWIRDSRLNQRREVCYVSLVICRPYISQLLFKKGRRILYGLVWSIIAKKVKNTLKNVKKR